MSRNVVELPGKITVVFGNERILKHFHCALYREGNCEFINIMSDNNAMMINDVLNKLGEYFTNYPAEVISRVLEYEYDEEKLRERRNDPYPVFNGWDEFTEFHTKAGRCNDE